MPTADSNEAQRPSRVVTTFVMLWASLALCVAAHSQAPAQPIAVGAPSSSVCVSRPEMTFSTWTSAIGEVFGEGPRDYIFADGTICSDTDRIFEQFLDQNPPSAKAVVVVFNSAGGDADAAMRLGAVIRAHGLWTQVGSQYPLMIPQNGNIPKSSVPYAIAPSSPPFAGVCDSACSLAFMGGVQRMVDYASNIGVHQFESGAGQGETERELAAIVSYISQMGVSPNFIVTMLQKRGDGPDDLTDLTMFQMQQMNVVTPQWRTSWKIRPYNDNSGFFLRGDSIDLNGAHEIAVECASNPAATASPPAGALAPAQTANAPAVTGAPARQADPGTGDLRFTFYLDPGARGAASDLVSEISAYGLAYSGEFGPHLRDAAPGSVAAIADKVATAFPITQADAKRLAAVQDIGIVYLLKAPAKMRLLKFEAELDGDLLAQFAATCR